MVAVVRSVICGCAHCDISFRTRREFCGAWRYYYYRCGCYGAGPTRKGMWKVGAWTRLGKGAEHVLERAAAPLPTPCALVLAAADEIQ